MRPPLPREKMTELGTLLFAGNHTLSQRTDPQFTQALTWTHTHSRARAHTPTQTPDRSDDLVNSRRLQRVEPARQQIRRRCVRHVCHGTHELSDAR